MRGPRARTMRDKTRTSRSVNGYQEVGAAPGSARGAESCGESAAGGASRSSRDVESAASHPLVAEIPMVRRVVSWIAAALCLSAAYAHGEAINLSCNNCASGPNAADD